MESQQQTSKSQRRSSQREILELMRQAGDQKMKQAFIKELPSQHRLKELFDYQDGCLFWKNTAGSKALKGSAVGWIEKNGYMATNVDKKRYRIHRIIFMYHYGWCPDVIDHIDGNRANNRIENLRASSWQKNQFNKKTSKNNKLGLKGVCIEDGRHKATIKFNNKSMHIGYYDTAEQAHEAYMMKAKEIFGEHAWKRKESLN